ncbi:hypothetical protein [Aeromicrobium sp. UC242_57]|uniref:hypothetical protein n=1 Tax=Aeromicrobium sp. UC242_57 TaxID=3374624 RepID=UPI0037A34131
MLTATGEALARPVSGITEPDGSKVPTVGPPSVAPPSVGSPTATAPPVPPEIEVTPCTPKETDKPTDEPTPKETDKPDDDEDEPPECKTPETPEAP